MAIRIGVLLLAVAIIGVLVGRTEPWPWEWDNPRPHICKGRASRIEEVLPPSVLALIGSTETVDCFLMGGPHRQGSDERALDGYAIRQMGGHLSRQQVGRLRAMLLSGKNYCSPATRKPSLFNPEVGYIFHRHGDSVVVLVDHGETAMSIRTDRGGAYRWVDPMDRKLCKMALSLFPDDQWVKKACKRGHKG